MTPRPTNQIVRTPLAFAVPAAIAAIAAIAGIAAGQWWFDLGLRDSNRWSHLSGEISAKEMADLRSSAILIGSIAGIAVGGASSVIVFLSTRRRPS